MKTNRLIEALALAAALAVSGIACKTNPYGVTKLPDDKSGTTGKVSDLPPGSALPGSTGPGSSETTGIAAGPGHPGWEEHRDILEADTVHFDYDSTVIKAKEKPKLAKVADYLKSNASEAVKIEGHCDERGTDEYNRALGERRAGALREELVRLGIDPNRVDTISFGRDKPVDTGHSEAAHAKNRRGEFVVLTAPK